MRRVVRPELLDSNHLSEPEVRESLADLAFINSWFGGIRTTAFLIERVHQRTHFEKLTLLDVGAGSGDGPACIQRQLARNKISLRFTLLDRNPAHIRENGLGWKVSGDALQLPFRDNSFDLVTCSLLAHHLEPEQFAQFAKESLRVARMAWLINDLRRSRLHLALIFAGFPLFRSQVTRHDSVASLRRAYTAKEMRDMLQRTPASEVEVHQTYLYRMGAIAWK